MEDNLVRLLQGSIDERGVAALARELGHGEGEVGSALSIVIPTFVSGLAHKAMTRGGAAEIMSALRNADERWLDDVPGSLSADRNRLSDEGSSILNLIFGRKLSSVLASVGSSTGLGKGGAGSLMRLHAPIALATVARHYRGRVEGVEGGRVQGVQALGPMDGDDADGVLVVDAQAGVGHGMGNGRAIGAGIGSGAGTCHAPPGHREASVAVKPPGRYPSASCRGRLDRPVSFLGPHAGRIVPLWRVTE